MNVEMPRAAHAEHDPSTIAMSRPRFAAARVAQPAAIAQQ